jgi:hypothetical protein
MLRQRSHRGLGLMISASHIFRKSETWRFSKMLTMVEIFREIGIWRKLKTSWRWGLRTIWLILTPLVLFRCLTTELWLTCQRRTFQSSKNQNKRNFYVPTTYWLNNGVGVYWVRTRQNLWTMDHGNYKQDYVASPHRFILGRILFYSIFPCLQLYKYNKYSRFK